MLMLPTDRQLSLRRQFYDLYKYSASESIAHPSEQRPFLSVITRTQGIRLATLRETLMSMAGQRLQDFEIYIVVHSPLPERVTVIENLVSEFPVSLTKRISVIQCARPGRSAPLNEAIEKVRGRYVSVLDDDDYVFSNWVSTFKQLASDGDVHMLRSVCVKQEYQVGAFRSGEVPRAISWFKMAWPATYDAVSHLFGNFTPFMSVAVPIEAFRLLRLRWDELLSTAEDWELTTHVAMNFGVKCSSEISAVYRWWTNGSPQPLRIALKNGGQTRGGSPSHWIVNRFCCPPGR